MSGALRTTMAGAMALATAWGCGASTSSENNPTGPLPKTASVAMSPSSKTFRAAGDTLRVQASARDASGGSIAGKSFAWSTSNPAIASVDAHGLVRAFSRGTVQIRAEVDGVEGTTSVSLDPWTLIAAGGPPAAGVAFACASTANGALYCWSPPGLSAPPVLVSASIGLVQLSAGKGYWCGVSADGTAWCWGDNRYGQLGDGTFTNRSAPTAVVGGLKFIRVAGQTPVGFAGAHVCGVAADSSAHCWGTADQGQLGIGFSPNPAIVTCNVSTAAQSCAPTPVQVAGTYKFRSVSSGSLFSCAISNDAHLTCWGNGVGSYTNSTAGVPEQPALAITFASVNSRFEHSCGVTTTGQGYCWGSPSQGQLGGGATPFKIGLATRVLTGAGFALISPGLGHTCGITDNGGGYCWGGNSTGQLGNGTNVGGDIPVRVTFDSVFTSLDAGVGISCGIVQSGAAYCWGLGFAGQLGDGTQTMGNAPVRMRDP
jgi:hypothetical protein